MKQTTIRINRLELRLKGGAAPNPADVARKVAEQLARGSGQPLPQQVVSGLADRLNGPLVGARRK